MSIITGRIMINYFLPIYPLRQDREKYSKEEVKCFVRKQFWDIFYVIIIWGFTRKDLILCNF